MKYINYVLFKKSQRFLLIFEDFGFKVCRFLSGNPEENQKLLMILPKKVSVDRFLKSTKFVYKKFRRTTFPGGQHSARPVTRWLRFSKKGNRKSASREISLKSGKNKFLEKKGYLMIQRPFFSQNGHFNKKIIFSYNF